jgi:hypothetical protein
MKISTLFLTVLCAISINVHAQTQITIGALRALATASTTAPYFISDPGREGLFSYDANDRYTLDNGGTVIVSGTKRYKRVYSGGIDIRWFGGVADFNGTTGTDNAPAINAAMNAAVTNQNVIIPAGAWYIQSTITLPTTSIKRIPMLVYGNVTFLKGNGFVLSGPNQDFRSYACLSGGNTGATTEAAFAAYTGTGIYLKNAYNSHVEVNEIKDFKFGIMQAGDKPSGTPDGAQYNQIFFGIIHNNYVQIKITIIGTTTLDGNWNNETFWYGGQIGKGTPGVTYGAGGWYGITIGFDPGATAGFKIDGHIFHNVGFEGIERALVMKNCSGISFQGGGVEPKGSHYGIDLDPVTCFGTEFIGYSNLYETSFVPGRLGQNTVISSTPFWIGDATARNFAGMNAVSISASRWMITAPKYDITNFTTYKNNDLYTISGPIPTLQALTIRQNSITRSVGFKSTYLHVTSATAGSPITLPLNLGLLRVEATQAKVFKVDSGDLVSFGEGFFVEYISSNFPISFVRADNGAALIPATSFPIAGTYKCTWAAGVFRVARLSNDVKTFTQTGAAFAIGDGVTTHYVNYQWAAATATLPSAATYPGRTITVKNLQAGKTVTIAGVNAGDENVLQGRGSMTVQSDGTTWNVISFYKRAITY